MTKSNLNFQKYVATGNDFLFVDAREGAAIATGKRSAAARRLCDRHFGAGADGLIFVGLGQAADHLKWDFYNSDGSPAEMCGNASRCVGRWAQRNLGFPSVGLETVAGLVRIETGERITSHLEYVSVNFSLLEAEVHGKKVAATFVNTGVPHAVVEIDRLERARETEFAAIIQAFRWHPLADANGTNVTFLQLLGEQKFATMTFERGVEGFTLSCGTGVLAAAAVGVKKSGRAPESTRCELQTPGGALSASFGPHWKGARLEGAADFIYEAQVPCEVFGD